ncbi:MAG: hypothetical protein LC126_19475, partial [Bryobacterales bacterium]|nr:hypothetical protein [Bryobacterales bacterium]
EERSGRRNRDHAPPVLPCHGSPPVLAPRAGNYPLWFPPRMCYLVDRRDFLNKLKALPLAPKPKRAAAGA